MIHHESAADYHARQAYSAGFCWELLQECPAQAWFNSCFNPDRPPRESNGDLDFGTVVHLATLENHLLADRVMIIDADAFRTKEARSLRDQAIIENKIPLLFESARKRNSTRYGFEDVQAVARALRASPASELLFGPGENEVSFTWEWQDPLNLDTGTYQQQVDRLLDHPRITACKARADRIIPNVIVDLKTAASASPAAFSRAMVRDGHHLRAAWYLDGARENWSGPPDPYPQEYLFVVVAKPEPHLVSIFRLDDRSLEWGRRLYRKALSEIRRSQETKVWSGYSGQDRNSIITASLPAFAERQLVEMELEDNQ